MMKLSLAIAGLTAATICCAQDLTLVKDGLPKGMIVISEDAAESCVLEASNLLNSSFKELCGTRLPVVSVSEANLERTRRERKGVTPLLLGRSAWTDSIQLKRPGGKADAFIIRTTPDAIVLLGNDDYRPHYPGTSAPVSMGSYHASVRFLESLGMRIFGAYPAGRIADRRPDIVVRPMNRVEAPYFPYRWVEGLKMEHKRWAGYGYDRDFWATKHTFEMWRNWGALFTKSHPEYFCLDKSNCLSNNLYMIAFPHDGVAEEIEREAKEYLSSPKVKQSPGLEYFVIIQNDYFQEACACERCQRRIDLKGDPRGWFSDYVADAAVKVAGSIAKDLPDAKIVQSAYEHYQLPPKRIERYPSNVIVAISQTRERTVDATSLKQAMALLDAWQMKRPGGVAFQRYYMDGAKTVPHLFPHALVAHIKAMKDADGRHGVPVFGEMHYARGGSWWFDLMEYVTARTLWNPDLDIDALLDDFCLTSFGPAAPHMRKFLALLERLYVENPDRTSYDETALRSLRQCVEAASKSADAEPFAARVAYFVEWFRQTEEVMLARAPERAETAPKREPAPKIKYDFDGELSDVVEDGSGDKRHAILVGAKRVAENGNGAVEFNGQGSYIKLREALALGEAYSLEAMIKPYAMDDKLRILGENDTYRAYHVFGSPANCHAWDKVSISLRGGKCVFHEQGDASINSPVALEPGKWHHVVGARAADGSMKLYVDGKLAAFSAPKKTDAKRPLLSLIGASGGVSSRYGDTIADCRGFFYGMMNGVRVYDSELSPGQVQTAYEEAAAALK